MMSSMLTTPKLSERDLEIDLERDLDPRLDENLRDCRRIFWTPESL